MFKRRIEYRLPQMKPHSIRMGGTFTDMRLGCFPVVVLRQGDSLETKEDRMARTVLPSQNDLSKRVLRIVRKKKMCDLDELLQECILQLDAGLPRSGPCLLCKKASMPLHSLGLHNPIIAYRHQFHHGSQSPVLTFL